MNDQISNDQMRRELREIDRDNTFVMPKWREALERIMGGDEQLTEDEKASLLGVPSPNRRGFFKLGGATMIGAAVLAACGSSDKTKSTTPAPSTTGGAASGAPSTTGAPTNGSTPASGAPTTAAAGGGGNSDLVLARTAASLEKLAVDVYGTAAALLTTAAVKDAATMFAGHHQMHLDALNSVITKAGGKAVTEQNKAVYDALIAPALAKAKTEADALMLAVTLEEAAAQTYTFAGGKLSTPELRSTIMTIGGVEARHAAVLRIAGLAQTPAQIFPKDRGFFPGDNPLVGINGALITA